MKQAKIYTWGYCPYCRKALSLLKKKDISFVEIGIDGDRETFEELSKLTGQRTVPFVFIDDEFIGGYSQLESKLK
ncbi:glutaredoxin family protein [Alkalibacter saccharofermentans]|uniref:Glutaredoxin 3 n=1 Tax=Alkalibacter saccharofermentans DSM 14828 TaxID=1120975 RepID=A0A1M4XXY8_9FIRM|nr:glutaredoxin domain-containing protein [Alkalibacter saccharofermentans]SHE98300.1 glutaredoxin 3 [Alkalibacter saccharofermentans DSM 14828]